jgi:protein phosphatase 1L
MSIAQELDSMDQVHDETALGNAFLRADKVFTEKATFMGSNDGSTAMAALLRGDRLIVANCGDSQGMLCRRTSTGGTELLSLCTTQKPNREDEKERVKNAGGTVVWFHTWRVNGVLAVTRSIGDRLLKHIIIPQPEIQVTQLSPDDEFVVLATDGLWDYMTEEEVATFIRTAVQTRPREEVSGALIEHVVSGKNSKDNVTVIIVFFDHSSSSSSSSSSSAAAAASSTSSSSSNSHRDN